jgi:hypothetical protein
MDVLAHPVHLMVRLDGEPVRVVEKADTVVAGIYNVVEYVPRSELTGAVEDRDALAGYLRWLMDGATGRPEPMTSGEALAMVTRILGEQS